MKLTDPRMLQRNVFSPLLLLLLVGLLAACSSSKKTAKQQPPLPDNEPTEQAEELSDTLVGADVEKASGRTIKVTFSTGLLFDFDSAALQPKAVSHLQNLAQSLNKHPYTRVAVVGHTDSVGTDTYNQQLSEERAAAAAEVLIQEGVAPDRITSEGRGEVEPIASNETEEGQQKNRRVEVVISVEEPEIEKVSQEAAKDTVDTVILW